jgi:type II secretory pathway pseudopilin PulG
MRPRVRAFTLVEITIALSLLVVLMSLVVVRMSFGSARQQTISAARSLGNLLGTYREKAMTEERLYALHLDLDTGQYAIYCLLERNAAALNGLKPLKSGRLTLPLAFGKVFVGNVQVPSPVTLFLDPKGIVPDVRIEVVCANGPVVAICPDVFANENDYVER